MDNFYAFDQKVQAFLNKYYGIQLLRGFVLLSIFTLGLIVVVSSLEYFIWFPGNIRLFLLLASTISFLFIFVYFFMMPLFRRFGLAKRFTFRLVNQFLLKSFPSIGDKIVNVYELHEEYEKSGNTLLLKSLNAKIEELSVFNFSSSVAISSYRPLFVYGFLVLISFFISWFTFPDWLSKSSYRILNPNSQFNKELPFHIVVLSETMSVERGNDFTFKFKTVGDDVSGGFTLQYGNSKFLLKKLNDANYEYIFKNVNQSFEFQLFNDNNFIGSYVLQVLSSPTLDTYKLSLEFPDYLNKVDTVWDNTSNLIVPRGTILTWSIECSYTDSVLLFFSDSLYANFNKVKSNSFEFKVLSDSSFSYNIKASNLELSKTIIPVSTVSVIPDFYPTISYIVSIDDINPSLIHFAGTIIDDYGFYNLQLLDDEKNRFNVNINKHLNNQRFFYSYELPEGIESVENLYFVVKDNDVLNGYKSTKSSIFSYQLPDEQDIIDNDKKTDSIINTKLKKGLGIAKDIKKDIEDLEFKLFNNNLSNYDRKKLSNSILDKHNELQKLVDEISKEQKSNVNKMSYSNLLNDDLLNKQKQLEELFNGILDDELKSLIEQLNELQNNFTSDQIKNITDEIKLSFEDLEKSIDKNLELLKKYEVEKELDYLSNKLNALSEEYNETDISDLNKKELKDTLLNNNRILNKGLKDFEFSYDSLLSKNRKLNNGLNLPNLSNEVDELTDFMDSTMNLFDDFSKKDLKLNKNKIGNDIQNLSDKVKKVIDSNLSSQNFEDAFALRQILDNSIYFSIEEEKLMLQLSNVSINDPNYISLWNSTKKLNGEFKIIEDSLYALGARNPVVSSQLSKSINDINKYIRIINDKFDERKVSSIVKNQQFLVSRTNDLILLLSEALKNMDDQANGSDTSSKSNRKKRKQKPSLGDLRTQQESLKNQLNKMINNMKNSSSLSDSEKQQLGNNLKQQELFQEMLRNLSNGNVGDKTSKFLKEINKLIDENKQDIIRSNYSPEFLSRQDKILTRLLEAENAEKERDTDKERKAELARDYKIIFPDQIFEDENENSIFNDYIFNQQIKLSPFYEQKTKGYLQNINNIPDGERN